jgi:SH3-like domain-containing protein
MNLISRFFLLFAPSQGACRPRAIGAAGFVLLTALMLSGLVFPLARAEAAQGTGLPLPRFVSLRSDEVNVRTGPGSGYPIDWVFTRRGLPVEVVAEFDVWRRIRDIDGTEGWVHRSLLRGARSILVTGSMRDLHDDPSATSNILARLEPGVVAALKRCQPDWCEIQVAGYEGWMKRDELWGVYPDETIE